jgi:SAM-dependent methyltransferase
LRLGSQPLLSDLRCLREFERQGLCNPFQHQMARIDTFLNTMRRRVPLRLRRLARKFYDRARYFSASSPDYAERRRRELHTFTDPAKVDELPAIAHYWSNKHLVPMLQQMGFSSSHDCIRAYLAKLCRSSESCVFLSIGSGKGDSEIQMATWFIEQGLTNFSFECLDINEALLARGRQSAAERGMNRHFSFKAFDVNAWAPAHTYDAVVALQSLHHVVELEKLFEGIHAALKDEGYFLVDDMIGRNGHQRWPEALNIVQELWRELPDQYRYNQQLKRFEKTYQNWDCSKEGFEGIRAQDILPLLMERFHFELFFTFGNLIDVFIDRGFGHNFDPAREWDREFIDRVHALDVWNLEQGVITPTHMLAVMKKGPLERTLIHKHFTPERSVRRV